MSDELFIHGLDANIQLGNSYFDDRHATLKADYVMANPPFDDGSKGESGWGADRIADKDPRLTVSGQKMPLSPRSANTMWMLHFLSHLKDGGTAGFVMATGELTNGEIARLEVRKALVEQGYVDCIVQLTGQLFANTQIPCSLWFLSKNRKAEKGYRERTREVLFIDGRKLGTLITGSRKQKELSTDDIERMAACYRAFRRQASPDTMPGFVRAVPVDEIRNQNYALASGRYVGAPEDDEEAEPFETRFPRLLTTLHQHLDQGVDLRLRILSQLERITR